MMKLIRFMKPFSLLMALAIALLFAQAQADLALPDYMSKIVNVGIQQGGYDSSSPKVMTQEDYSDLKLLLTDQEIQVFEASYTLVEPGTQAHSDATKAYDALGDQVIYVRKAMSDIALSDLDDQISQGLLLFVGSKTDLFEDFIEEKPQMPQGLDLFEALGSLPQDQALALQTKLRQGLEAMDPGLLKQAGARAAAELDTLYGVDTQAVQRNYILTIGGIMLLYTLIGAACAIGVGYLASKVSAGLGRNLRNAIFEKIESFSNYEFDTFSTASLITRSTNDVMQIQSLMVLMVRMLFYAPILGVGGIIRALSKSTSMSWIIAMAVIVLMGFIALVFSIALPKFKLVQKKIDRINLVMREALSGMMVIRAFNTQAFEEDRFDQANHELTDTNLFVSRIMVFLFPVMMFIMNSVTLVIVWVGAKQIEASAMQVGDMMAFMQYALQIIMAFLMLSMMFIMVPRASVSAERIAEVLDTPPTVVDPQTPVSFDKKVKGTVVFDQVSFKYPGAEENMLKNISFTAKPGQMTAIVGSTGSGKTTLINMIPRFYDVSQGRVLIDGIDVRDLKQADVRNVIGYVPQKASLFTGSVESNLLYGDQNASQDILEKALDIAQAKDFVDDMAKGMASDIAQGGQNVSGGQKQRLSIARALVKKPQIFIFDDSFSALDFKTDRDLRKALKTNTGDSTLIVVAQRISTIKKAEQILVLEDGKVVGQGTHDDLMATCATYQEIAYSQLSKEELS